MKITTQLIICFFLVSILPLMVIGVMGLREIRSVGSMAVSEGAQAVRQLGEEMIAQKAEDVARQMDTYIVSHPGISMEELQASEDFQNIAVQKVGQTGYVGSWETANTVVRFHPNPSLVNTPLSALSAKLPYFWALVEQSMGGKSVSGYYDWQEKDNSTREKYMAVVPLQVPIRGIILQVAATTYIDEFFQPIRNTEAKISALLKDSVRYFLLSLGAVSVFAFIVALWAANGIVKPILRIRETALQVAAGDLSQTDETFQGLKKQGEIGQLLTAFSEMTKSLRNLIGEVRSLGITVMSSTTEISASARQLEATAAHQASSIIQVSATSKEISAGSKDLVQTMNEVSLLTAKTAAIAEEGHAGLQGMESTMRQFMEATASIASKLETISVKTNNIGSIVTTVTQVADQTNLLSFNAAIEAEKAGEYGRGFSVVAREIRRLADQTAVATLDIEQMVKEMLSAVSSGVMEADKFVQQVRKGIEEVARISDRLTTVIDQVQALLPRFDAVKESMETHSAGAEEISKAMVQLSEAASQTKEMVSEFNQTAKQLGEIARRLQEEVSRFKI